MSWFKICKPLLFVFLIWGPSEVLQSQTPRRRCRKLGTVLWTAAAIEVASTLTFYQGREAVSGQQRQCWELNVGVGHGWTVGSVISITCHSSGHPHNHGFTIGSESKWRRQGHNKDSINLSCYICYVMLVMRIKTYTGWTVRAEI